MKPEKSKRKSGKKRPITDGVIMKSNGDASAGTSGSGMNGNIFIKLFDL